MMCDRACTPPTGHSPPARTSSRRSGIIPFVQADVNVMPRKKASRVERRLGLDDDEDENTDNNDTDLDSGSFATPRGSWPPNTQPPAPETGELSSGGRPSDGSVGRLTNYDGSLRGEVHRTGGRLSANFALGAPMPLSCQTPEVNRTSAGARVTGGGGGGGAAMPVIASLLYTPQIAPALQVRRSTLDAELDTVNAANRMYPMPPVTQLIPGKLYIGGLPDEETIAILRSEGIRYIINCASQDYVTESAVAAEFCVVDIEAFDSVDYLILHHDLETFASIVDEIIEHRHEKVFVHCIAGINRSVTLCCAYLMEKLGCTPVDIVRLFRENGRMRILENVNFRHQLIDHYVQVVLPNQNEDDETAVQLSATQRPPDCHRW